VFPHVDTDERNVTEERILVSGSDGLELGFRERVKIDSISVCVFAKERWLRELTFLVVGL
jgi:hypothetical protein